MVPKVMVCVTRQKTCERLIKIGTKIALDLKAVLSVVHVAKTGTNFLGNPDEGEALDHLFQISKNAGADMSVLRSDNVVNTLVEFAKKNKVSVLILGESPDSKDENNIIKQLQRRLPDIDIQIASRYRHEHRKLNAKYCILPSFR